MIKDEQVRVVNDQMLLHGQVGMAALRGAMHRDTARKYVKLKKLPSETKRVRNYKTRQGPFDEIWPKVEMKLEAIPEVEAKILFENWVQQEYPDRFHVGQLRTFQRNVHRWRAEHGPPRLIFFPQVHRPGEIAQLDWTNANELGITIAGQPFEHLLCHAALIYSNFEWATVCRSESLASIRSGFQGFVFQLGRVPEWLQTDNSSAATHNPGGSETGRVFNDEYVAMLDHFGVKPRTTAIGAKEQNGDVESLNNAIKNRLEQHLLLRGSRDFDSEEQYEEWVQEILRRVNGLRKKRLEEELEVMRRIRVERLPEYTEKKVRVKKWSTIRIKNNTYSVPSRLLGETVSVRIYDDRLEVYYAGKLQLSIPRLLGESGHLINYRHIIWSLVRKPGAFPRYKYREDMFPTLAFRMAYDALHETKKSERQADLEYLRLLHLAASTMEADVEVAIELLLEEGLTPCSERVKDLVNPRDVEVPEQEPLRVDLSEYDALINGEEAA